MMSGIQGGDFMQGFASGALGSLGGSAFMTYGGQFASSTLGNYAFSGLAGGVGAELTGGNFWEGAAIGIMTAGLNHLQQGINRPKFDDLLANYPTENGSDMPAADVYELIGGDVLEAHNSDPEAYHNACALRVSRALNYSGVDIPRISDQTLKGADGKHYFYRASDLYKWMSKPAVFGNPNYSKTNYSALSGKGIYIMQASYPSKFGAWGHATLFNNGSVIGKGYINATGGVHRFNLWNF